MDQAYHRSDTSIVHPLQYFPVFLQGVLIPDRWMGLDAAPFQREAMGILESILRSIHVL
jgi:hypothetical protein